MELYPTFLCVCVCEEELFFLLLAPWSPQGVEMNICWGTELKGKPLGTRIWDKVKWETNSGSSQEALMQKAQPHHPRAAATTEGFENSLNWWGVRTFCPYRKREECWARLRKYTEFKRVEGKVENRGKGRDSEEEINKRMRRVHSPSHYGIIGKNGYPITISTDILDFTWLIWLHCIQMVNWLHWI